MNIKIISVIVSLLVVGLIAFSVLPKQTPASKLPYDFGDAPDGKAAGKFPSLLKSDGARAKRTDQVWLGQAVTMETDSKQVNLDENDDGFKFELDSCTVSKAYFFVHLKNPVEASGTAYLNLYADWNKDGQWQGDDGCAPEWAVRNFSVDLSRKRQEIAVYTPEFTAGKNIQDLWYRAVVSLDQQMNEAAKGEFESGEVEDYSLEEPGDEKYYGFYCLPNPLEIKHGSRGDIKILPVLFSEPISAVEFGPKYSPVSDKQKVSIKDRVVTYESLAKDVDPPKRTEPHNVDLKASFGAGGGQAVLDGQCAVNVEHDERVIETPSEKTPPRRSFPSPKPTQTEPHVQEGVPGLVGY